MQPDEYLAAIVRDGELIAAQPIEALDVPVPTCPGWKLERLVAHLGRVHRWATSYLAGGAEAAAAVSRDSRPPSGPAIMPWYRESYEALIDELNRQDPDAPADTFTGPGTAGFWFRRQAHETAVHRWDAENAVLPGAASRIDARLAADGIDEWLTVFVPRILAGTRTAALPKVALQLDCVDVDAARWTLTIGEDGPIVRRGRGDPHTVLRGAASDLLLAVWRRMGLDGNGTGPVASDVIEITGNPAGLRLILDAVQVR